MCRSLEQQLSYERVSTRHLRCCMSNNASHDIPAFCLYPAVNTLPPCSFLSWALFGLCISVLHLLCISSCSAPLQDQVTKLREEREQLARDVAVLRTDLDTTRQERDRLLTESAAAKAEVERIRYCSLPD